MSIPTFLPKDPGAARPAPGIAVRISITIGERTERAGIVVTGSSAVLETERGTTSFPTSRLWSQVRELLPDLAHLRQAPAAHGDHRAVPPDDDFVAACEAAVVIAVGLEGEDDGVAVRTWLATADEVYAVGPGGPESAAPGAVASALLWDVTGAMERLVETLGAAS